MVHRYSLSRWDLLCTQLYGISRNPVMIPSMIVISTFVGFLDLQQPEMAARPLAFKVFFIVVFDVVFTALILAVTIVLLWPMILFRKHRGLVGEHTLEITPLGLVERTEFNEGLHRWHGIHKIVRTRRYLYVWVTDSNLHCVPMRSFASEEAAKLFQDELEVRRTSSGEGAVKT